MSGIWFKLNKEFHNQNVVLDTATPLLYIGHLVDVDDSFLTLEKVDVHDLSSTPTSKDVYLIDTRKLGIKVNRERDDRNLVTRYAHAHGHLIRVPFTDRHKGVDI